MKSAATSKNWARSPSSPSRPPWTQIPSSMRSPRSWRTRSGPAYPPDEMTKVEAEGMQRVKDQRPPGYADAKKEGSQAAGDYVLWRQLLDEAATRKLPVLLVTNDQKEDWYRKLHGITIGPRIELISEMLDEAGVPFHAQTLERFLGSAAPILRSVKETTVTEVRRIAEADRTARADENAVSRNPAALRLDGFEADTADFDTERRRSLEDRRRLSGASCA